MPQLREESFGSGDTTWLGSTHGMRNARTGVIDPSKFTKSTHYPDGYFRSGTPVNAADEKDLKPFTGANGEQLGFVLFDRKIEGTQKTSIPLLRHGTIDVAKLPIAFTIPTTGANAFVFVNGGA